MDTYVAEQGYDPNNFTYLQPMPVSYSPEHYEYYPPMPFAYPRIHPWPPGYHQYLMPPHMMEMGFPHPWALPPYMTMATDDRKCQKLKKTKKPKNISADPLFQRFCQAKYGELVQLQPQLCRNDIIKILEGLWSQMPELDRQLYAPPNIPQVPVPGQAPAYQYVEFPSQFLIPVSMAGNANSWPGLVLTQPQPAPNPQPVGETAESFIADLPNISDDVLFQIIKEVGLQDSGTVTLATTDQKQQEADVSGKVIEVVHPATKCTSFEPHDGSIILPGTSLLTVNNPATGSQKLPDHSFSKPPNLDDGCASKSSLSSNDQRGSVSDCFLNETASDGKTSYSDPVMTLTSASHNASLEGLDISITFSPNSGAINTISYDAAAGNANETMPVKTVSNANEVDSTNYHQQTDMFDLYRINPPVQEAQDPSHHLSNTDMPFDPQQDNIFHVTMAEMASLCDASRETIRCASEILSAGENGIELEKEVDVVSQVGNLITIPEGCTEGIDSNYFNMQQNHDEMGEFSRLLFEDQDILINACQMSTLLDEDMTNQDESGSGKPDDAGLMDSDWGKVSGSENLKT